MTERRTGKISRPRCSRLATNRVDYTTGQSILRQWFSLLAASELPSRTSSRFTTWTVSQSAQVQVQVTEERREEALAPSKQLLEALEGAAAASMPSAD